MPSTQDILKKYWGYSSFRPLQEEIIQAILNQKDTLALLPTGGGKSICFQIPALYNPGICIVISPLIALMKDQVEQLRKRQIPAEAIYSGMHYKEIDRILDNCIYGNVKLLYLSPERLQTDLAIARIKKMNVNLIAVDEAHCVSQWGYDFRPSYLEVTALKVLFPAVPILALTATATPKVQDDIQSKLDFKEKHVIKNSFQRFNLSYSVLEEENKTQKTLDILKKVPGTSIIYVRSRKKTKVISEWLRKNGISSDYYHAGLSPDIRHQKQDNWTKGQTRVIVSTNAFGMGIDKPDVRTVIHIDLPDSIEAYFQEAGRAGRDEKKAYAILLYNNRDEQSLQYYLTSNFPEIKVIKRVYQALGSYCQLAIGSGQNQSFDFEMEVFAKNFKLNVYTVFTCLKILEQAGWIILSDAIYQAARLMILVTREQLYDYQIRNRNTERLIKSILRTYQGAFQHYVHLHEQRLAQFLKISSSELKKMLFWLQKDNIIEYIPMRDKPQLIFTKARVDSSDLLIDQQLYNFRKNRYTEQVNSMIHYINTVKCRNQLLLQYFGEDNPPACNMCDVCLGRTQPKLDAETFQRYKEKIKYILSKEMLSLEELIASFPPKREAIVLKTLELLTTEALIIIENNKVLWKN